MNWCKDRPANLDGWWRHKMGSSNRTTFCKRFLKDLPRRSWASAGERRIQGPTSGLRACRVSVCRKQGRLRGRYKVAAWWGFAGRVFQCGWRNPPVNCGCTPSWGITVPTPRQGRFGAGAWGRWQKVFGSDQAVVATPSRLWHPFQLGPEQD